MKHAYTKEQMQATIDEALKPLQAICISTVMGTTKWDSQTQERLAIMQAALAALPEPEPPTVDGKTPEEIMQSVYYSTPAAEYPFRKAASAVLAAFGGKAKFEAAVKEVELLKKTPLKQKCQQLERDVDHWCDMHTQANARAEKAEAELARIIEAAHEAGWNGVDNPKDLAEFIKRQAEELAQSRSINADLIKEQLSKQSLPQLHPISEAGPLPEGCMRVTGFSANDMDNGANGWVLSEWASPRDTHFADIQLPPAKAEVSAKPDLYAELKAAQADGKTIEVFVKDDEYGPDRWSKKENNSWTLPPENYRIKPEPQDPYDELKKAHAEGKVIQTNGFGDWLDLKDGNDMVRIPIRNLRIKPDPETFEAHGKTWTRHTPGDAMPCDGERLVACLFADGDEWKTKIPAWKVRWSKIDSAGDIIGWRYADEPTPEPLEPAPWTPKVGDVVTLKSGGPKMVINHISDEGVYCSWFNESEVLIKTHIKALPTACLQPA